MPKREKHQFYRGLSGDIKDANSALGKVSMFLKSPLGKFFLEKESGVYSYQICIRDNYINIYWNGCSVLKYRPLAKKNIYSVHYKYVIGENLREENMAIDISNNPYVRFVATDNFEDLILENHPNLSYKNDVLDKVEEKIRDENHVRGEKQNLADYLKEERDDIFLLDLEVAFTRERKMDEKMDIAKRNKKDVNKVRNFVADRLDMAQLEAVGDRYKLRLVEVKRVMDPRVRKSEGNPEVASQMAKYEDFVKTEKSNIVKSYKRMAENYKDLELHRMFPILKGKTPSYVLDKFIEYPGVFEQPHLLLIGPEAQITNELKGNQYRDHFEVLRVDCKLGSSVYGYDPDTKEYYGRQTVGSRFSHF